ncbi:MAG: hypothetical protein HY721_31015, partial [Planctomycetes bacterium]|nr:hypothetical protein [Planctomycetota bacterium]
LQPARIPPRAGGGQRKSAAEPRPPFASCELFARCPRRAGACKTNLNNLLFAPGGRLFASIIGHYSKTYEDSSFRAILLRGMAWAAGEPAGRLEGLAAEGAKGR